MIKFYLSTVVIWFIITMAGHIVFHKEFIKSRNMIKKATNDDAKEYGYIKTFLMYTLICFIPIFRLASEISFYVYVFRPNDVIIAINKSKKEKNDENI